VPLFYRSSLRNFYPAPFFFRRRTLAFFRFPNEAGFARSHVVRFHTRTMVPRSGGSPRSPSLSMLRGNLLFPSTVHVFYALPVPIVIVPYRSIIPSSRLIRPQDWSKGLHTRDTSVCLTPRNYSCFFVRNRVVPFCANFFLLSRFLVPLMDP